MRKLMLLGLALGLAMACLLAPVFLSALALAADGIALAPGVPDLVVSAPALTLPWGAWLTQMANVVTAVLVPVLVTYIGVLVRQYVPALGQVLTNALIDRMVRLAADFALAAIEGAAKGRTTTVAVAPAVIALGAQRAVDTTLPWIVAKAGGPQGIAKRLFRHLDLDPAANANNVLAPALDVLNVQAAA